MTVPSPLWRALLIKQYGRETCFMHPRGAWQRAATVREALAARRRAFVVQAAGRTP